MYWKIIVRDLGKNNNLSVFDSSCALLSRDTLCEPYYEANWTCATGFTGCDTLSCANSVYTSAYCHDEEG